MKVVSSVYDRMVNKIQRHNINSRRRFLLALITKKKSHWLELFFYYFSFVTQRSRTYRDPGQRRTGTERRPVASTQQRRGQTHVVAVHSRSRGRRHSCPYPAAEFLLGMGLDSRVSYFFFFFSNSGHVSGDSYSYHSFLNILSPFSP